MSGKEASRCDFLVKLILTRENSSMSAWIGTKQYLDYFNSPDSNLQGGVCIISSHSGRPDGEY